MRLIENHTLACPWCFADAPKPWGIDTYHGNHVGLLFECKQCNATMVLNIDAEPRTTNIGWMILTDGEESKHHGHQQTLPA